jgi:hypothetical protein
MELPEDMVLVQEPEELYAIQTTEAIPLKDFNHRLTRLLETLPWMTKEEFLSFVEKQREEGGEHQAK